MVSVPCEVGIPHPKMLKWVYNCVASCALVVRPVMCHFNSMDSLLARQLEFPYRKGWGLVKLSC